MLKKMKSDSGLMGPSHALSAIAITLLVTAFASNFMFETVLGTSDFVVYLLALVVIVGAALMPDLDATKSTSISTLGIIGTILSTGMRFFSKVVQSIIRAKGDSPDQDPHRGFWHTILAAFIIGALITLLTTIDSELFKIGDKSFSVAFGVVVFIVFLSTQLFIASLVKPLQNKMKKSFLVKTIVTVVSLILTSILVLLSPPDLNYNWVGAAVTFGWIAHLVGDMMTVAGVPVFFPLKIKGKRWWNVRFPFGIRAGSFIEYSILTPIFIVGIIIGAIMVFPLLT